MKFQVQRIYVAYSHLELLQGAATFHQTQDAQTQLHLNVQHQGLKEQQFLVTLTGTVLIQTKDKEESKVSDLAKLQVKQAGIFTLPETLSDRQQKQVLRMDCA